MRPYFTSWETSSHYDVDCMTCHARAGVTGYLETKFTAVSMLANYFTGIYKRSKPWAEIEDGNCLGCHTERLLEGKISFTKGIVFDHEHHLTEKRRGRKLRCTSCHSQIVQGKHMSVTSSTCFLCHFKNVDQEGRSELANCTSCHTPPTVADGDSTIAFDHTNVLENTLDCKSCHTTMWHGNGKVREEKCSVCHSSTAHADRINDLEFIHEWHIEKRKVECQQCHDPIDHRNPDMDKEIRGNCAACHDNKHSAMNAVYHGEGSKLIEKPMPFNMMDSGVVCISCHKESSEEHGGNELERISCEPCHQESYDRLAKDWHIGFNKRIKQLEGVLKKSGMHPRIEDARQDLALLKKGGAWHNPHFADSLLSMISNVLENANGRHHSTPDLPEASQKCLNCHTVISELTISKQFSSFDHNTHLSERQIACIKCHYDVLPENSNHGKLKSSTSLCSDCHHAEEKVENDYCEPCHFPSKGLFLGKLPGLPEQPSPMAESEMTCKDCHIAASYKPPDTAFCLDCHDQDVLDHQEFVRGELLIAVNNLERKKSLTTQLILADPGRVVHHPDLAKKVLTE